VKAPKKGGMQHFCKGGNWERTEWRERSEKSREGHRGAIMRGIEPKKRGGKGVKESKELGQC